MPVAVPAAAVPPPPVATPVPTPAPVPVPAPSSGARLGLIVAITAVASSVLSAGLIGGALWMTGWRPAMMSTPEQARPQSTASTQQVDPGSISLAGAAPRCKTDATPAFLDDFGKQDPGWNLTEPKNTYYDNGNMVIKPEPDTSGTVLYRSLIYKNATFCLNVKTPQGIEAVGSSAGGLIFWAVDYRTYYVVFVYSDGNYQIYRRIDGSWITVSSKTKSDAVKAGMGAVNQIAVTTLGNVATLSINNTKVHDIRGQPPKNGGTFGMYGQSEKGKVNDWRFLDISVVELPASQTAVKRPADAVVKRLLANCKAGNNATFADDFAVPDPGWISGVSDNSRFIDGHLQIKAAKNASWRVAYWGQLFKNPTICADVKSPTNFKNVGDTTGGLLFWATDFDTYYSIILYADGSYSIIRRANGSAVRVTPKTPFNSIKQGAGAENRIKVVTNNKNATLYINDVKVQDFIGQPPAQSSVGFYGESEGDQANEWTFLSVVVIAEP